MTLPVIYYRIYHNELLLTCIKANQTTGFPKIIWEPLWWSISLIQCSTRPFPDRDTICLFPLLTQGNLQDIHSRCFYDCEVRWIQCLHRRIEKVANLYNATGTDQWWQLRMHDSIPNVFRMIKFHIHAVRYDNKRKSTISVIYQTEIETKWVIPRNEVSEGSQSSDNASFDSSTSTRASLGSTLWVYALPLEFTINHWRSHRNPGHPAGYKNEKQVSLVYKC